MIPAPPPDRDYGEMLAFYRLTPADTPARLRHRALELRELADRAGSLTAALALQRLATRYEVRAGAEADGC